MSKKSFSFERNGKTFNIPSPTEIPFGVIRKTRHIEDEMDKTITILEELLGVDSEEMKAIDSMTITELTEFVNEWTSGATLGESSGSES